jgi:hydroxymethylpyrimidine pyrophosphatase-like HAD family hydrolase
MHIVFDMDNTLSDELGRTVRPGIVELLDRLKGEGHTLSLWTSSTRIRALLILRDLGLREYFITCIFREDYDPESQGKGKDIRRVNGDCLIDDDPKQVKFVRSVGKKAFLIKPYRGGSATDHGELDKLYKSIRRASGFLGSLFK